MLLINKITDIFDQCQNISFWEGEAPTSPNGVLGRFGE
jgi:hypothetical protein